jgi:UDP-N-acetylmuramate dehydrogenase
MTIDSRVSLKPYNSFGLDVQAEFFTMAKSVDDVMEAAAYGSRKGLPLLVLGGGSNVLLRDRVNGLVMVNRITGIELAHEDEHQVWLRVGAGENWHSFVEHCIAKGYAGVENLALIPGCVGASPMQNIGAYGVEINSVFEQLEAIHLATGQRQIFDCEACQFGYRESVFKRSLKGQYVITHVTYRLSKTPSFNVSYGAITQELERMGITDLSLRAVADAVMAIRRSKLPDPAVLGNAGSFFKNPVVGKEVLDRIAAFRPDVPSYPAGVNEVKLAAGWLIEQAGWKGYRSNGCGVHDRQALVLVNHGGATGDELYALSSRIIDDVQAKFGVLLEREVNII